KLSEQATLLREAATATESEFPGAKILVDVMEQYRNLGDGLDKEPRAVKFAELAHERLGRSATREIIRGGTDGSMLTALGLPTPNLSSGQHNPHSPLEWACLDEMVGATEVVLELARVWAEQA
ncbi:MAG: peptidase T, partial [Planctomycetota bacterium]